MNRFPKKIDGIGAKFIAVSLNKTKFLEWSYLNNNEMSTLIKKNIQNVQTLYAQDITEKMKLKLCDSDGYSNTDPWNKHVKQRLLNLTTPTETLNNLNL